MAIELWQLAYMLGAMNLGAADVHLSKAQEIADKSAIRVAKFVGLQFEDFDLEELMQVPPEAR